MDALVVGNFDTEKPVTLWEQSFALAGFAISGRHDTPTSGLRAKQTDELLKRDVCPGPHYRISRPLPEAVFFKDAASRKSADEFALAFNRLTGVEIPVKPLFGPVLDIKGHKSVVVFDPEKRTSEGKISFSVRDVNRQAEMQTRWNGDCDSGLIALGVVSDSFIDLMKEHLPARWQ
jgi:hypothetical protein